MFLLKGGEGEHKFAVVEAFIGKIAVPKSVTVEFTGGEDNIGTDQSLP